MAVKCQATCSLLKQKSIQLCTISIRAEQLPDRRSNAQPARGRGGQAPGSHRCKPHPTASLATRRNKRQPSRGQPPALLPPKSNHFCTRCSSQTHSQSFLSLSVSALGPRLGGAERSSQSQRPRRGSPVLVPARDTPPKTQNTSAGAPVQKQSRSCRNWMTGWQTGIDNHDAKASRARWVSP